MTNLSARLINDVSRSYTEATGMRPLFIDPSGTPLASQQTTPLDLLPGVTRVRAHALSESLRWGEPYIFFLAPGVISWIVPLLKEHDIIGGIIGGEVVAENQPEDRSEAMTHFATMGLALREARRFVHALPAWPQMRSKEAADHLFVLFYQVSGWTPARLLDNREQAEQQRQIAEEIHRRKNRNDASYPVDDERMLIELIRVGDRNGARRLLNRMLGAIFLRSADLAVVRALMIEMMGYLVRSAVEDSPYLAPLLERNHEWMARIIQSESFEELSNVLRQALDDFMNNIYMVGYEPAGGAVQSALEYIATHFRETVTLSDVATAAGLSSYRIAHLLKEQTGKTAMQHVHRLRIQEAKRLLEQTHQSCADIAYEVGFGDQSYFTKQFRVLTGTTPAKHRRLYRRR